MTRVPITSPLAVLATRTTQEHLMATHSTTDLKPGDIVEHPEHGYGVVLKNFPGVPTIYFAGKHGYENTTRGFTGWERVETCTTDERRILDGLCGRYHVFLAEKLDADEQGDARGGDRETERASGWFTCPWCQESVAAIHLASRDANGCVVPLSLSTSHRCPPAQRAESTPPAESHTDPANTETAADSDAPDLTMGQRYRDNEDDVWEVDRGGRLAIRASDGRALFRFAYDHVEEKWGPLTLVADEKPASATVTLPCPDCGEDITNRVVARFDPDALSGGYYLAFEGEYPVTNHRCPPVQPDEPTEFGARIVVTDDLSGKAERWCRQHDGYWANEDSELMTWAYLCQRGTVTIGWDE